MKIKFLALCATAFVFASCTQPTASYTVKGVLPDSTFDGKTMYMLRYDDQKQIDSTVVVGNSFAFEGKIDTAAYCRVSAGRQYYANLVLENGIFEVDFEAHNASSTMPMNMAMNELRAKEDALVQDLRAKMKEFETATENQEEVQKLSSDYYENEFMPLIEELYTTTFLANTNNPVGVVTLQTIMDRFDGKSDEYFAKAGPMVTSSNAIQKLIKRKEALANTAEGKMFTDFTIEQEPGNTVKLSDYVGKGKYVLVDFWASWCGPCIREIPFIKEAYNTYAKKGLDVISLAVWDKVEDTKKAIKQHDLPWTQIINGGSIPTDLYGVNGIPHIILFGPDGTIIARDLRGEGIKAKIAEYIK
ncbi:DUF4369 domain-containing protein [Bacteroides sp. 214]|uniref:redoxin domain-containing protein n=1 Tax=Bacteroides sp. 214 TaxID=2302935 RepID=UPI0013D44474|nr:redoxin domain-containing protein [Bacteroides sp. 214]NDW11677.1 DUF4369 domain-containing protein [Bacteroides sp. 214]